MPNLLRYLTPDSVILPLSSSRKVDAIRELASLYRNSEKVTDFRAFLSALLQKEQRFGSGVEHGVALPHYRVDSILEPIAGLGVSRDGLDWGAGQRVQILVLVGWPNKHQGAYLKTVAELASVLHQPEIRSQILKSNTCEEVVKTIRLGLSADVTV